MTSKDKVHKIITCINIIFLDSGACLLPIGPTNTGWRIGGKLRNGSTMLPWGSVRWVRFRNCTRVPPSLLDEILYNRFLIAYVYAFISRFPLVFNCRTKI